ncbi:MAG: DNA polymerase III subunit delta [archaeon]
MEFKKLYYIISDEPYLVKKRYKELKEVFIGQYQDMNFVECTPEKVFDNIETIPFMAEKKMIHILNPDKSIEKYLSNIPGYCIIILTENLDKRTKLYKTIKKMKAIENLKVYNENQLLKWLMDKAKSLNGKLSKVCAIKLLNYVGNDMFLLENQLKKLISYSKEPNIKTIDEIIEPSTDYNAFILTDYISKKDKKNALKFINKLGKKDDNFIGLLAMAHKHISTIYLLKTTTVLAAKKAGIHSFAIKKVNPYVKNFTKEGLEKILNLIQTADYEMKNGLDQQLAIEKVIVKL